MKGECRYESTHGNGDFDEVKYSKELLACLNDSQVHSDIKNVTSGSNLASALSCLGIEVVDRCRSTGKTKTRKQPSKQFAKRSQSMTSTTDKCRESSEISRISTIAQNDNFRKENRKYRTVDAPMKGISYPRTELLDGDFDNVQFSKSSSRELHLPLHKPSNLKDIYIKRHDSGSKLESTLSCMGIEVIEPKHAKRKTKCKRERHDGNESIPIPINSSQDNNAKELTTHRRKSIEKPTEDLNMDEEQNNSPPSRVKQKLNVAKSASAIDKQHQYTINNYVKAENKLLINQIRDPSTKNPDNSAKRNKYLWSKSYDRLKSLSQAVGVTAKPLYTESKHEIQSQEVRLENEYKVKQWKNRYTETENVNGDEHSQNKHLNAIHTIASKFKPKQSECTQEKPSLKLKAYCASECLAKDDESYVSDNHLLSDMDKQTVNISDPGVKRSVSMPSEYTLYYKQKMLLMDTGYKSPTKDTDTFRSLGAENLDTDSKEFTRVSEKSQRKRKHSMSKLLNELDRDQTSKDKNIVDTIKQDLELSKTDQNGYMSVQRKVEANIESDSDQQDKTGSKTLVRTDISIIDSGLSYKELLDEEYVVSLPSSKTRSKVGLHQRNVETTNISKEESVTNIEPEKRSTDNTRSNINPNAEFGKYVKPKQVKTAVVRPMRQENKLLSRSDSFTYPYSEAQSYGTNLEYSINRMTFSDDLKLSQTDDLESSQLDRTIQDTANTITRHNGNASTTTTRPEFKTAIRRKPSMEMQKFVNMSSLINANIVPATYPTDSNTIVQNATKAPGDRPMKFHSERKPSFKFSNTSKDTSTDGHKSKALLFSRGMNEENTSKDLNDSVVTSGDTESETNDTILINPERNTQMKHESPYRSASFLIQSTVEKSMTVQRSKSDRKVAVRGSKL